MKATTFWRPPFSPTPEGIWRTNYKGLHRSLLMPVDICRNLRFLITPIFDPSITEVAPVHDMLVHNNLFCVPLSRCKIQCTRKSQHRWKIRMVIILLHFTTPVLQFHTIVTGRVMLDNTWCLHSPTQWSSLHPLTPPLTPTITLSDHKWAVWTCPSITLTCSNHRRLFSTLHH